MPGIRQARPKAPAPPKQVIRFRSGADPPQDLRQQLSVGDDNGPRITAHAAPGCGNCVRPPAEDLRQRLPACANSAPLIHTGIRFTRRCHIHHAQLLRPPLGHLTSPPSEPLLFNCDWQQGKVKSVLNMAMRWQGRVDLAVLSAGFPWFGTTWA